MLFINTKYNNEGTTISSRTLCYINDAGGQTHLHVPTLLINAQF